MKNSQSVLFRYKTPLVLMGFVVLVLVVGISRRGGIQTMMPQQVSKGAQTVVLREEGYDPATVTVTKGTTVIFTSTRNEAFWPASDLHPTHDIYPEFDPKEPIEASKSWSFRFDKVGSWKYHDHLFPYYRGTITVTNPQ